MARIERLEIVVGAFESGKAGGAAREQQAEPPGPGLRGFVRGRESGEAYLHQRAARFGTDPAVAVAHRAYDGVDPVPRVGAQLAQRVERVQPHLTGLAPRHER